MSDRTRARRIGVRIVGLAGILLLAVGIALTVLLLAQPPREWALRTLLEAVESRAPGGLTIGDVRSPRATTLELRDIRWTHQGATHLDVRRVLLELDAAALRRRELRLTRVEVDARWIDAPAIGSLLASSPSPAGGEDTSSGGGGALPFPASAEDLRLAVDSVRVTTGATARRVRGSGRVDLSRIDADADLDADVEGVGGVHVEVASRGAGSLSATLRLDALGADPLLRLAGTKTPGEDRWALVGELRVPAVSAVSRLPVLADAVAGAPDLEGFPVELRGSVETGPSPTVSGTLRAGTNAWLERLDVKLAWRDGTLRLEPLDIAVRRPDGELFSGTADARWDAPDHLAATVRAHGLGHSAAVALDARLEKDGVRAAVSPLDVRLAPAEPVADAAADRSELHFDRASSLLEVQGLEIVGDYGRARADARRDAGGRTTLALEWAARELPSGVARLVAEAEARKRLRDSWRRGKGVRLRVAADVDPATPERTAELSGRFVLPGPEAFAPLLPAVDVQGMGALSGRFTASAPTAGPGVGTLQASWELEPSTWLDSTRVDVQRDEELLRIRSTGGLTEGLAWNGQGTLTRDVWEADVELALDGTAILRRVDPRASAWDGRARATVSFRGPADAPELDVRLEGQAASDAVSVPSFEARIDGSARAVRADLTLPDGLVSPRRRLDSAHLAIESSSPRDATAPWTFALDASGPDGALSGTGSFARRAGGSGTRPVHVAGESLRLVVAGQDLKTTGPFALDLDGERIAIEGLDLRGTLGTVRAAGVLAPGATDVTARAELTLPQSGVDLGVPEPLWPRSLSIDGRLATDGIRVDVHAAGLSLDPGRPSTLRVSATGARDSLEIELDLEDASRKLVTGRFRLPLALERSDGGLRDAALQGSLRATRLPLPATWVRGASDRVLLLDGELRLGGTTAIPELTAEARVTAPEWPRLRAYTAAVRADLGPAGDARAGLDARWSLERDGTALIDGTAFLPLRLTEEPFAFRLDRSGDARLHVDSKPLPLDELNEILPPHIGVGGTCRIRLDATGSLEDPDVDGNVSFRSAQVTLAEGSRLVATGSIDLAGRWSRPAVEGKITVDNGLLVVPEPARELYPTNGDALLWESGDLAPTDSSTARRERTRPVDLNVEIDVPGNVWIRGRGIDVELEGSLRFVQKDAATLDGALHATRGQLQLLGRTFDVRKGTVTFRGGLGVAPELDIQVESTVANVLVMIRVGGTADKPTLTLTSEPELSEGDITSLLLFGRRLDELSDDQLGLVQTRTGDVARSFGIARVEDQIRRRVGLDLLRVRTKRLSPTSVLVGKYLSPHVLLKFEQMLDERTGFLVNLEYLLTRRLKLETILARPARSGMELNWTRDY